MEILASPAEWLANDAENLSKFLETETGKRLIPELLRNSPALLAKGDVNEILIRSGEVRAWSSMVENLLILAHPPAPVPRAVTEYPPLESDEHWSGPKLSDPETGVP